VKYYLKTKISQGSVVRRVGYGGICNKTFFANFCAECDSEEILTVIQYLAKIWTKVFVGVLWTHSVQHLAAASDPCSQS